MYTITRHVSAYSCTVHHNYTVNQKHKCDKALRYLISVKDAHWMSF